MAMYVLSSICAKPPKAPDDALDELKGRLRALAEGLRQAGVVRVARHAPGHRAVHAGHAAAVHAAAVAAVAAAVHGAEAAAAEAVVRRRVRGEAAAVAVRRAVGAGGRVEGGVVGGGPVDDGREGLGALGEGRRRGSRRSSACPGGGWRKSLLVMLAFRCAERIETRTGR